MIGRSFVGFHASTTASQTSRAYSTSVAEKLSGEYWKRTSLPARSGRRSLIQFVPRTAIFLISSFDSPNTTSRCAGEVELYRWMMTFFAPRSDCTVRSIRSSRAWTRTWIATSSGMRPSSIRRRLKSNSVWEAEGKPTSISLKPTFTSVSKSSSFCSTFIGTASAWFPSRRSTLHQRGACVRMRDGQRRSSRATGGNGRYFWDGFGIIGKRSKG